MSHDSSAGLISIIEAALFAAGKALTIEQLQGLFDQEVQPTRAEITLALAQLTEHYAHRGVQLYELATGYRFQTAASLAPWVQRLWEEKPPRLSRAVLETLALMAYRQPITRGEIEDVRGVAVSSNMVRTLLEREWIRVVGQKEVPGRPAVYAMRNEFLAYFNLRSLDELPTLADLQSMLITEANKQTEQPWAAQGNTHNVQQDESIHATIQDDTGLLEEIDLAAVDSVLEGFDQRLKEANAGAEENDEDNKTTSLLESV